MIEFDTIFVPVDFSVNTDTAIEKAAAICAHRGCIHLFHVQQTNQSLQGYLTRTLFGYSRKALLHTRQMLSLKLEEIKNRIVNQRPDIIACSWLDFGQPVEQAIIKKVIHLRADLVIIGKNKPHPFRPYISAIIPCRVANQSGVAVLTVKPGSRGTAIKTVVITIGKQYPDEKVKLLRALHTTKSLKIRLVSFRKAKQGPSVSNESLIQTLRALKQLSPFPIEYDVLNGNNTGMELFRFCQTVSANMLIAQAGNEMKVKGWLNRYIADVLPADSSTQILAVSPHTNSNFFLTRY